MKEGRFLQVSDAGIEQHRHQPEDRQGAQGRRRQAQEGRRPAQDRLRRVHDHRDLRDGLVPARPGDRHGHRHGPQGRSASRRRQGFELLRRGRRPRRRSTRSPRRIEETITEPAARRPEHVRVRRQLRHRDGPARHVPADDRQPGAARGRGRDHQHDADEHDRAVRRVRRPADQRLVEGQRPVAGDDRERLPRPDVGGGRLPDGLRA